MKGELCAKRNPNQRARATAVAVAVAAAMAHTPIAIINGEDQFHFRHTVAITFNFNPNYTIPNRNETKRLNKQDINTCYVQQIIIAMNEVQTIIRRRDEVVRKKVIII